MYKYILYYYKILKICGLKKISDDFLSNEKTINIINEMEKNNEINSLMKNDEYKLDEKNGYKCMDIIYILFIIILISWKVIFVIYYAVINRNYMVIFRNLFECSIPFQYYYGYQYFKTDHFVEFIKKIYIMYPKKFNLYVVCYMKFLLFFSFIYSILSIGILFIEKENVINNIILKYVDNYGRIPFYILFFVENFFSINIYLLNTYIFTIIFRILSLNINNFYKNLENNGYQYIPSELCNNMLRLRNDYEIAVENLNSIFSTIIFFGFISMYVFLLEIYENKIIFTQIFHFIIFVILYLIYFYSIYLTNGTKNKLQNFIYSNNIIEKLLSRKRINKNNIDYHSISIILDSENAETLDWFITYQIFKDEWDYFKIFGFVIDDVDFFKKIFVLVISLYATGKFAKIFDLFN